MARLWQFKDQSFFNLNTFLFSSCWEFREGVEVEDKEVKHKTTNYGFL